MSATTTSSSSVTPHRSAATCDAPHELEREVQRRLHGQPGLDVKSLVVRRTPNGICLEGRIEVQERNVDVRSLMADIPGLGEVINHLVVCRSWSRFDDDDAA
jgi:hypothetical protein